MRVGPSLCGPQRRTKNAVAELLGAWDPAGCDTEIEGEAKVVFVVPAEITFSRLSESQDLASWRSG